MNYSTYRVSLDIHASGSQAVLHAKKGETKRRILITLTERGKPYLISSDCTAVFTATKPDGNIIYNDCAIDNNIICYNFTEQTTAAEGKLDCEIRLYGADNALIISPGFDLIVDAPVYEDGDVIESGTEVSALTALVSETNTLIRTVNTKLENGEFNGQTGKAGGWYTPAVTQPNANTMRLSFSPSKEGMPAVAETDITLPLGGGGGGSSIAIDETLTKSGQAADAKTVGDRLDSLSEEIANLSAGGISATARELLITVLRNGVYISDQSANITDLETALGGSGESGGETEKTLISISATYSGGDVAVGTAVTDLTGIVVTATYSDGSTATVTDYTMSGEIAEGENTITVTYEGMTTTFTVTGIAESSGGEEVSVDIQSLLTANGYYYDGYASINGKTKFKGTSLDGGTTPAYAIQLVSGATYTLKTALDGDGTGVYGPGAFSGATDGNTTGAWRGNINKISSIEKTSEEINSGVYLLTYTFKAPIGTTYLSVGCLNEYVSYASLSYHQE